MTSSLTLHPQFQGLDRKSPGPVPIKCPPHWMKAQRGYNISEHHKIRGSRCEVIGASASVRIVLTVFSYGLHSRQTGDVALESTLPSPLAQKEPSNMLSRS